MDDTEVALADELRARFAEPVRGPAYRPSAKWLTVSTLITLAAYGAQVVSRHGELGWGLLLVVAAAGTVLLVSTWYILNGNTTIDADGIRQDWMFEKRFSWDQVLHARHLRMPFTSRLLVGLGRGPIKAIHGGCSELDAAFKDIGAIFARRLRR